MGPRLVATALLSVVLLGCGGDGPGAEGGLGCDDPPCPCSLLGNIGKTTVSGTPPSGSDFSGEAGEDIYGPFEAGFGSQQDSILERLGCSDPSKGYVEGGIDTATAEGMIANGCGIAEAALLDACGGHTREYHFHERLSCLYAEAGAHSARVGLANDNQGLYGKWEDFENGELPALDACGGHFGPTPDSDQCTECDDCEDCHTYHYHVQDSPPFFLGCFGPDADGGLVSLSTCRGLYPECGDAAPTRVTTNAGTQDYDLFCPCYDADGSNVGTKELPALR